MCIQEKEQRKFFSNFNASNPEIINDDDKSVDSQSDTPTPKRRRRKNSKTDPSSSSSEDDLASDLKRINDKKDKKLNKDITTSVNTPLSLGLKYLITDDVARAPANETAILLRAIKPVTATMTAVLKNDRLLDWDHMLVLNAIQSMLEHQIDALRARKKHKLADKLDDDRKELMCTLIKDQLLTTPKTMHATFNALFTKDHHFTNILNLYTQQRDHITAQPENRQKSISRITGHCIGYNFKSECENTSCGYLHHCLLHNEPHQHKTMLCNNNPNKWKRTPNKPWDNKNYRRRPRGRGNKFIPNVQFQNPVHVPHNHPIIPQQQYIPNQQMLHYPQQPIYPQPQWDKKGNKDRYNPFPHKK